MKVLLTVRIRSRKLVFRQTSGSQPRLTYNLTQICRILEFLPLLPKAVVETAAYAGLREGELRGLEWTDYAGDVLSVNRSIWKTVVNKPKTRASAKPVPVIRQLAEILETYRKFYRQSHCRRHVPLRRG